MFADTFAPELDDGGSVSVLEQLYADLTLLPAVIEETWRFYPPFPAARRRVIAATELGGQSFEVGTWVVAWLTAANRDPGRFPDPNRYDIRRPRNRHLTLATADGVVWARPWLVWRQRSPSRSSWSDSPDFAGTVASRWPAATASSTR